MKIRTLAPILLALFYMAPSCGPQPQPQPPIPPAPVPTQDAAPAPTPQHIPGDGCQAQCDAEHALSCPEWRASCADDCRAADAELAAVGSPPPDHACVVSAKSCDAARKCK